MFTCYDDQYSFAKESILKAIESGNNIVLYGSGCNGKSYLIQEIEDTLVQHGYFVSPEPSRDWTASWWNNFLEAHDASKWVTCINDENHLFTTFSETSYTLINMNKFRYPSRASLRSGRTLHN